MEINLFILHGDDEQALERFLGELKGRSQALNIIRLDARSSEEDFSNAVATLPFFAEQRLVIYHQPLGRLTAEKARQRFLAALEGLAETTTLALVIEDQMEKRGKERFWGVLGEGHWLVKWAKGRENASLRAFARPEVGEMTGWVLEEAKRQGGEFKPAAAAALAAHLGNETRIAGLEIEKLLTYAAGRAVEAADVELLTPAEGPVSIFEMVDALAAGESGKALKLTRRLLETQDAQSLFAMIVRQFRLLLQAREILDEGGDDGVISGELRQVPFVAKKLANQARRFRMAQLEKIYRRLLEMDEAAKTSQSPMDASIDLFIADLAR